MRWGKSIKLSLFCIVLFINLSLVSAYQIKIYDSSINCIDTIKTIPQKYFNGLKQISVMNILHPALSGEYYPQLVYLVTGCDKQVLIHELAHHLQFTRGDSWHELISHGGNFYDYQEEIYNAIV